MIELFVFFGEMQYSKLPVLYLHRVFEHPILLSLKRAGLLIHKHLFVLTASKAQLRKYIVSYLSKHPLRDYRASDIWDEKYIKRTSGNEIREIYRFSY